MSHDTNAPTTLVWFRDDLRLHDNAALAWAARRGRVVGVYVHETVGRPMGAAARWWLGRSLEQLRQQLSAPLIEAEGDPREIIPRLAQRFNAAVTWNRRYHLTDIDAQVKEATGAVSHPGFLLTEPWEVRTGSGTPYRVFTPFSKKAQGMLLDAPTSPTPAPAVEGLEGVDGASTSVDEPEWSATLAAHCTPGERAALARLDEFVDTVDEYDNDALASPATSGLSAHLRFGELSPATVWHAVAETGTGEAFLRQLLWRDFAWHRYYHLPDLATVNVRAQFNAFDWEWTQHAVPGSTPRAFAHPEMDPDAQHLEQLARWQRGETGVPLVDAGMRQLWQTGTMHNRVRMVAGSWLTKNLGIHWRHGEEWFWDTLVDADVASNPFNWQWVAGCGDDAAPYFRIFNPLTQQQKFDPDGGYVRRWVPEASTPVYPGPMVDVQASRKVALAAYDDIAAHH